MKKTKNKISNDKIINDVFKSMGFNNNEIKELKDIENIILTFQVLLYNKIFIKQISNNINNNKNGGVENGK